MPVKAGAYKRSSDSSEDSDDEFYDVHVEKDDNLDENIDLTPTKDVTKLRRRRKLMRKRYWDRVLKIAYEHEKTKPYDETQKATGEVRDWRTVHSTHELHEWLNSTTAALPSKMGEGPVPGKLLQGKHYRLFKRAGNLIYAKCAFLDDYEDYPDDDADHLKEAGGPDQSEYRKNFDYMHHLEKVRSFPTTLKKKKKMLRYLNSEAELFKQMRETNHRVIVQSFFHSFRTFMSDLVSEIAPVFQVWETRIRNLYAYFGNEVHLCFIWFRKLLLIQVGYMLLSVLVLILPEVYHNNCVASYRRCSARGNCQFDYTNLLTGDGWVESWCSYYGGFSADPKPLDPKLSALDTETYRLVIFWFGIVAINAAIIVSRVKRFKRFAVETDKETLFYFHEIFCSWEFSMNSIHLARIVQESIAKKLAFLNSHIQHQGTRLYYDETRYKRWGWLTKKFVAGPLGIKIYNWIVNIITVIIAGGSSFAFWLILNLDYRRRDTMLTFFLPGLYLSLMFHIVSPWVTGLTDMGLWKRKINRNYWSLFRLGFIYGCNYITIFSGWLWMSRDDTGRCFEDTMGETLYCIVVWEFIFTSFIWILKDFAIHYLLWKTTRGYVQPEPNMDSFFISCIFMQAFVAMGVQFAPFLPCICVLTWTLKFWLKNCLLLCVFKPSQVHSLKGDYDLPYFLVYYMFFVLATFSGLHFFTLGYPSRDCGPFMNYQNVSTKTTYKDAITEQINRQFFKYLWRILLNPAIGFAVVFIIFGAVYLVKRWGDAYQTTLDVYNGLLHLERQDRKYLLRAIYGMTEEDGNDFSLVLDKNNIYKAKVRFLASIIIGGKRHEMSQVYQKVMAKREKVVRDLMAKKRGVDSKQKKRIEGEIRQEVQNREDLAASVQSIEARRASLAQKFLMHTEAIRLAHTASRKERQRKWEADGVVQKNI